MKHEIIIEGSRVHDVGYRVLLLRYAQEEGFTRFFTLNRGKGERSQVIIRAEGSEEQVKSLLEYIKNGDHKPASAEVSSIVHHEYSGNIPNLTAYTQDLMFEQLSKGVPAILDIREMQRTMLNKQDQMLDKQDQMLDKQDQMIHKEDQVLGAVEGTNAEIQGLRNDMKTIMDRRFTYIEQELQTIKEALHKAGILA